MILIIGGCYQGKLEFAKQRFQLSDDDIMICNEGIGDIDLSKGCLAYLDRYALNRVRAGKEPLVFFRENLAALSRSVLISTDLSCGVVPMDATIRAWREACGRMNNYLASQSDEVWRLFCGIPQRIK